MPSKKIIIICLVTATAILFSGTFVYRNKYKYHEQNKKINLTVPVTPSPESQFNIIYQIGGDSSGRTTLYNYKKGLGGVGRSVLSPWVYMVGIFDKWETIPLSKDKYLYLKNPFTGEIFPKVRVLFENDTVIDGNKLKTKLANEDLTKATNGENATQVIGYINDISEERLAELIDPGDAIVTVLYTEYLFTNENEDLEVEIKDKHHYSIAHTVMLRRYGQI